MFNRLEAMLHDAAAGMMEQRQFNTQLRCYSAPFFESADTHKINELNHGGKILLPQSALDWLVRLNIQYPMMFRMTNPNPLAQRATHCGVLEFLANEGRCYLPSWMMRQLVLHEGDMVQIEYANLPKATYAKFKPQSIDFLNISNPRAVLEIELRKFACLTKGDVIAVRYNEQVLEFLVMEVQPGNAVAIIECDMNVEFDAPEGYVEPIAPTVKPTVKPPAPALMSTTTTDTNSFLAFSGTGQRLDGKSKTNEQAAKRPLVDDEMSRSIPLIVDVNYRPGALTFIRYDYKRREIVEKELSGGDQQQSNIGSDSSTIQPFRGGGRTLRDVKDKR